MSHENIFNLVPREYYAKEKAPMHKSCHDPKGPLTGSTFGCKGTTRLLGAGGAVKHDGALFGPRISNNVTDDKSQINYLRKAVRDENSINGIKDYKSKRVSRKPKIPSRDDRPVMGIYTSKNYVTANAVEAILQAPRVTEAGNPNYLKKEDFGKVPGYLKQVKDEIRRENDMIDRYVKEQMGVQEQEVEDVNEMNEGERIKLIKALKGKWNSVNAEYQKITHLVFLDTIGQVRRKESLEAALKQLETDIQRLERAGPILVR